MPVNTPHPDYDKFIGKVTETRDCYGGSHTVKDKGVKYLPRLEGQNDKQYNAFKLRGLFLPALNPAVTAFTGAIMRKDPVVDVPLNIDYLDDDMLSLLATKSIKELLLGGRIGGLVEHDGDKVKLLLYPFESILNPTPDYIVLSQNYTITDPNDKFKAITKIEYLELTYDDMGYYIQNIWRDTNKKWTIVETKMPTNRGEPLTSIPFSIANTLELSYEMTNPGMLEIATTILHHYRHSVDLSHSLHSVALSTVNVFGDLLDDKGQPVKITVGPGRANHIPDVNARIEIMEVTGAGLSAIRDELNAAIDTIASIGAKMMQTTTKAQRSTETARIEASGESATLSTIANSCEAFITQLLGWAAEWEGGEGVVEFKLNRDFLDTDLNPQQLTSLLATYHGGGMSLDTFLYNLQRGELLPKGIDIEDEKTLILQGGDPLDLDIVDDDQR